MYSSLHIHGSHQSFVSTLENIANKLAASTFHRLPAYEAKVVHMTNTLKKVKKIIHKGKNQLRGQLDN